MTERGPRTRSTQDLLSASDSIRWPPLPRRGMSRVLALLRYFDQTQWWVPERIEEAQFRQLRRLLRHAAGVPFYARRFEAAGIDPAALDPESWRRIPPLTRRDIQQEKLLSRQCPKEHGRIYFQQSSGSTGEPVRIGSTDVTMLFWSAFTVRNHEWHRHDCGGRLASIRAPTEAKEPRLQDSWGSPLSNLYRTGPGGTLSLNVDVSKQARWLAEFDPDYLLTYPSNLRAIIEYCREHGLRLKSLRAVQTISETVGDDLRALCREVWDVPLVDTYSSQEVGYMAMQCPDRAEPVYHVQAEGVYLEIVDDDGRPCRPGEVGRVIVTSLHNFATPLVRYEVGDRAEAGGEPCACGRGLVTLHRVLGRERNMLTMPDGEKRWPLTGYRQYGEVAPEVRQFQFIQRSREKVEVRLVVSQPMTPAHEAGLRALILSMLGHPFELVFTVMDAIPKSPRGKFEEFISEVA